jgi:hypothetical protein
MAWIFFGFIFFSPKPFSRGVGLGDRMRKFGFRMQLRYPHRKMTIFADTRVQMGLRPVCQNLFCPSGKKNPFLVVNATH